MDAFNTNKAAGTDESLYLGDFDGGSSPPGDGRAMKPSPAPWNNLYEIRHFLEHPFFSISHKTRGSLDRYVSRDGKLHVDVKATVSGVGVATYEDAEILMYVITELFASLMNDPSCREVTFKRCDLLRRLHRKAGGNQYDALEKGLIRLTTTQVVTNMGPDGRPAEPVVFSFLEGWEWSPTRRLITVRASEWIARAVASKAVLSVPEHYFDLPRGYERVLWRIARKHVGAQRQVSFPVLVETLRDKMGLAAVGLPSRTRSGTSSSRILSRTTR